jgi:hypothetical protein
MNNYAVTATLSPGGREHAFVVTAPDQFSACFRAALMAAEWRADKQLDAYRPSQARVLSVERYHGETDGYTTLGVGEPDPDAERFRLPAERPEPPPAPRIPPSPRSLADDLLEPREGSS